MVREAVLNSSALISGGISRDFDGNVNQRLELRIVKVSAMQEKDLAIAIANQHGDPYGFIRANS